MLESNFAETDFPMRSRLEENVEFVREQISLACQRSRRQPDSVKFVAVTKYAHESWMRILQEIGITDFGESRPQQLAERALHFSPISWHMVGHLQRNKVRAVIPTARLIHSVDSLRLANRIHQVSHEQDHTQSVLIEVNISGEQAKSGFSADGLRDSWNELRDLTHISVEGLMTMAPKNADESTLRHVFSTLRNLRDELSDQQCQLPELSMGMSGDFPIAIEEGATLVRVGSRLFDGLQDTTR